MYDDHNDVALLIVEAEEPPPEARHAEGAEGPGGFLKDDLLLNTRVSKEEKYDRQQGTYTRRSNRLERRSNYRCRHSDCLDRSHDPTGHSAVLSGYRRL